MFKSRAAMKPVCRNELLQDYPHTQAIVIATCELPLGHRGLHRQTTWDEREKFETLHKWTNRGRGQ